MCVCVCVTSYSIKWATLEISVYEFTCYLCFQDHNTNKNKRYYYWLYNSF